MTQCKVTLRETGNGAECECEGCKWVVNGEGNSVGSVSCWCPESDFLLDLHYSRI